MPKHSLTYTPGEPNEISWAHRLPIWSIPQLSFLKRRLGIIVTGLFREPDSLIIMAYLPTDKAYYQFRIYKSDMNKLDGVPMMVEVL